MLFMPEVITLIFCFLFPIAMSDCMRSYLFLLHKQRGSFKQSRGRHYDTKPRNSPQKYFSFNPYKVSGCGCVYFFFLMVFVFM